MHRYSIHSDGNQANCLADPQERTDRKITQMLMVYRIIFQTFEQVAHIRDLDDDQTIHFEQALTAA